MKHWPKHLPDYAWPEETVRQTPKWRRAALAGLFHVAHAAGRVVGMFDRKRNRVLVIRTDGVGDALLFEPALANLKAELKHRSIHFWSPKWTGELFAHCPAISKHVEVPRGFRDGNLTVYQSWKWRAKLGWSLGRWSFDKAIYPARSPEPLGNWLLSSARAQERWLVDGDTINQYDWQRQRTREHATRILHIDPSATHDLRQNENLAAQWSRETRLPQPTLHLPESAISHAEAQTQAWRIEMRRRGGQELLGVVSAGTMSINRYPQSRWIKTLTRLWNQRRAMPVLLNGPGDEREMDELAVELMKVNIPSLRLFVPTNLLQMAAIIGRMDGVVSVDTALAHMAIAQHVPTVVIVAGGNPGRFFPWPQASHHVALTEQTSCAGCNNRCTQSEAICITQIEPEQIAGAYNRLKRSAVSLQIYAAAPQFYQQAG